MPHSEFLKLSIHDRSKMMWHFMHTNTRCPGCGTHKSDWDEESGGSRYAFIADMDKCRGCEIKDTKSKWAEKADALKAGWRVILRRPKPEEMRKASGR